MKATLNPQNYTPHDITVRLGGGRTIVYESVGVCRAVARDRCAFTWDLETETECHVHGWGIAENPSLVVMRRPEYDEISWSPHEPAEGSDVIVSVVAAPAAVVERPDLRVFIPDTGPQSAIRYKSGAQRGQIEAIRRLVLWHDPRAETHLLLVISLVNPVNEGDGCYVHSRHLPTREGVEEALWENQGQGVLLELCNARGQSRLSAHVHSPGTAVGDVDAEVDRLWAWLQIQLEIEATDDVDEARPALRKLEDWAHPEGRTVQELLDETSTSYVAKEFGVTEERIDDLLTWAKGRRVTAVGRYKIMMRRPWTPFPESDIDELTEVF